MNKQLWHGGTPDRPRVLVTWPGEEKDLYLSIAEEDPIDFDGLAPYLVASGWNTRNEGAEERTEEIGTIDYPGNTRVYVDGKRISLNEAHKAIETSVCAAIYKAIEMTREEITEQ
jgi:hypothetical protein